MFIWKARRLTFSRCSFVWFIFLFFFVFLYPRSLDKRKDKYLRNIDDDKLKKFVKIVRTVNIVVQGWKRFSLRATCWRGMKVYMCFQSVPKKKKNYRYIPERCANIEENLTGVNVCILMGVILSFFFSLWWILADIDRCILSASHLLSYIEKE